MKIKLNNVFEKYRDTKMFNKINIVKRRNSKVNNEITEDNYENLHRRKGSKSNILQMIKNRLNIKKRYFVVFGSMVILAVISIYTNYISYSKLNTESYQVFNSLDTTSNLDNTLDKVQVDKTNNADARKEVEISKPVVAAKKEIKVVPIVKKTIPQLIFIMPLSGEIIKNYSMDKVIYSKTLESWKTHDGIDIKGNLGDNIKSIENGIIEKIFEDSFLGTTIIIDHGQGYKSIYSNLDKNIYVKEKSVVKKNQNIGKLGNTSIGEIKDENHIHFMLMLNNVLIDPLSKIKN